MERSITVKGMGKVSAAPDLITISFSLEALNADYEQTMALSASMLAALRTSVSVAGLDGKDLKTTRFTVDTKYENYKDKNGNWKSQFVGYICAHNLKLEFALDMKLLSAILSAVADCEAHPEFKIGFTVKDPAAVSELLLKNAIKDATRKAEVLAQASNVKLGMIQQIDYNWGELHLYSDIDMDIKMCADMSPMGGAIEIEPNDIDVSDSVTVVWAIE